MVVVCNIREEEHDGVEVLVEESDALSETKKNFRANYCEASIFGPYHKRLFSRGIEEGSRYYMYANDGGSHAYSTGRGARADGGSHASLTEGGARTDGGNRTSSTGEEARSGGGTHAYSTGGGTREDGGTHAYSTGRGAGEDGRNRVYSTVGGAGAGEGNHVYSIEGGARAEGRTDDVDSTGRGGDVGYVCSSRGRGEGNNSSKHGCFNTSDTGPQEYSSRGVGTSKSSGSKGTINGGGYRFANEGGSFGYSNGGRSREGRRRNLSWADDGRQGRRHTTAAAAAATAAKIDRGDCQGRMPEEEQGPSRAAGGGNDGGVPDCAQKDGVGRSKQALCGGASQEPAGDVQAAIQAMLARQCTNTAGFQDRMSEAVAADRESHQYGNSFSDSSEDEEGGVGSLSQFSFRRNRQAAAPHSFSSATGTSRPKTALQVMQEHRCACSTTEDSNRRTRSTSGRSRDLGGVTAGSTPGVPTGAHGVRGNPRAHATGGAYILRPDIPAPTSQSATPYMEPASLVRPPSLQRAPYLSLDGADEPVGDLAFDLSFDFPVAYGDGKSDGNDSAATAAAADMGGAPGQSVWKDYGLGLSGGDSSAVGRGGGGGGGRAKASNNALASHGDDTYGILVDEDDEAALALAADRLLGYDDRTTHPAGPSTAASTGPGPGPGSAPDPGRGPFSSSLPPPPGFSHSATTHTRQPWLGGVTSAATGGGGAAGCTFFGEYYMNPAVRGHHLRRSTSRLRCCSPDEGMGDGPVSRDGGDVTPSGLLAAADRHATERFPADGVEIGQVGAATEAETVAPAVEGVKGTTGGESRNGGSNVYGPNQRNPAPRPAPQPMFRTAENSRLFDYTRPSMVDQGYRAGDGGNNPGLHHEVASPGEGNVTSPRKYDLADCPVLSGDGGSVCDDEGRGSGGSGSGGGGSGGGIAQELLGSGDSSVGIGRVDLVARGQRRFGNAGRNQIYPPTAAYSPSVSNGEGEERHTGLAGGEMGRASVAPAEIVHNSQASNDNNDGDGSDDRHRADAVAAGELHLGEGISVAPSIPARSAFIFQPGDGVVGTARAEEGGAVGVEGGRRMLHDALLRGSASSGLLDVGGVVVAGEDGQRVGGGSGLAIEGNQAGSAEGFGIPAAVDGDVRAGGGVDGGSGVAVGGEDGDEDGGAATEATPAISLAPSSKSWFGGAAASCAMGLLRRCAQRTAVAVATTTSTSQRTPPKSSYSPAAFTAGEKPSLAAISGGKRLGAGWRRQPGAIPYREDVSCSIEEWGVQGGYRTSHHGFGCPL